MTTKTLVMPHLFGVASIAALDVSSENIKKVKLFAAGYQNVKLNAEHAKEVTEQLRTQASRFKNLAGGDKLKQDVEKTITVIANNVKNSQNGAGDSQHRDHQPQQNQQQMQTPRQHRGGQQT